MLLKFPPLPPPPQKPPGASPVQPWCAIVAHSGVVDDETIRGSLIEIGRIKVLCVRLDPLLPHVHSARELYAKSRSVSLTEWRRIPNTYAMDHESLPMHYSSSPSRPCHPSPLRWNQPFPDVTSRDQLQLWLTSLRSAFESHSDARRAVLAANPHHAFHDPGLQDVISSLASARIRVSAKLE
ncbi:hypothetical protein BOTBODRAFT_193209 [Botryobasidium botryosum FD-172 SS1]|uniref:Uncharacterized protein n=1 Tax=Botryobasidium botryosum (strain FD-172 SS1) TaxID=930990 RepID=A0A067M2G8_BOTB1|nr:hypothetical protein BOTBODRAFT_193209 [Botryobasidium botryosum FD-172 SS1]